MAARPRLLVTGATGFIGRRLVGRAIAAGFRVSCLVREDPGGRLPADVDLLRGDVTDRASVERVVRESRCERVVHLAGCVRALRWGGTDDFLRVNASGVEHVAAACAACGVPPTLVVVSSLAAAGPSRGDRLPVESDVSAPISAYGRSKLAGELAAARRAAQVPITIVRPPVVFGPGDRGLLPFFRLIARSGVHVVPGGRAGGFGIATVHVDDLADGLLLAAERGERLPAVPCDQSRGTGIYVLAADESPTVEELGMRMAAAMDRRPPMVLRVPPCGLRLIGLATDLVGGIRGRPGTLTSDKMREATAGSWTGSAAKARADFGWSPAASLDARLRETAEWYRAEGWL